MESWKYRTKSLQFINSIYLMAVVYFLTIYKSLYNENYFYNVQFIDWVIIAGTLLLLILSSFDKYAEIYQKLLFVTLCLITILITDMAYLSDHKNFVYAHLILLIITISVFNKQTLGKFIIVYLLLVLPFILTSTLLDEKKTASILSIFIILSLTYMKSFYDSNNLRAFKESSEFKEMLLVNAKEAFCLHEMIFDQEQKPIDYRFISVNKAFEEMTGLKGEDIVGKKVLDVLPKTERYWIEFYGEVVTKKEKQQTTHYSRVMGKFYNVSAYPVDNNKFAVLFNDVTDMIENEHKLKYALQRSEKADQLKNQFLRDVNHRLRTPLNGMMGMLQLIDVEMIGDENRELFDAMIIEMRHSRNVLNQISKYIDIQGMNFEFSRQDIDNLVQNEIDTYAVVDVDIKLVKDDNCKDIEVYIEKNVFIMTFKEVLSNAVKYTSNAKVEVTLHCEISDMEASHFLRVDIVDYGMGIAKDKLEYIFNEFYHHDFINIYRDDDKVSLSICKQLLLSIGGDILVESEIGVGTKFTIILPIYYI